MHLIDITVRNYRVHKELTLAFASDLQVIGGRNECGKSTLAEAIHRALFLKAKGNTEFHRAMASDHGGEPEVQLRFDHSGETYVLLKRFGTKGQTKLGIEGQAPLTDAAAEEALAKITQATGDKKAEVNSQWAHLWAWQDKSLLNPITDNDYPHQDLITEMQKLGGGAALMQSPVDQKISKRFLDAKDAAMTSKGYKAGSPAEKSQRMLDACVEAEKVARDNFTKTAKALEEIGNAEEQVQVLTLQLTKLTAELEELDFKIAEIERLEAETAKHDPEIQSLEVQIKGLRDDADRIFGILEDTKDKRVELKKAEAKEGPLAKEASVLAAALTEAVTQADKARSVRSELSQQSDIIQAKLDRIDILTRLADLRTQLAKAQGIDVKIAQFRKDLAKIPAVEQADLTALRKMTNAFESENAALHAMGVSIIVRKAKTDVTVGDYKLSAGDSRTVVDPTKIKIGGDTLLEVAPKNGDIADQREKVAKAEKKLQDKLTTLGVKSLEEAERHLHAREGVEREIEAQEAKRGEFSGEDLNVEITGAEQELLQQDAKNPGSEGATVIEKARLTVEKKRINASLKDATNAEKKADSTLSKSRDAHEDAKKAGDEAGETVRNLKSEIDRLENRASGMLETHGDMKGLEAKIDGLSKALADAEKIRDASQARVNALNPEEARSTKNMKLSALNKLPNRIADQRTISDQNRGILKGIASNDPKAHLESKVSALETAQAEFDRLRNYADAIKLLADTFQETQKEMNNAYTAPLVDKISSYAAIIFGRGAKVEMDQDGDVFSEPLLIRSREAGAALPFSALSGGAKELMASAMRLAMAEVLSARHGGKLPVVMDDTFSFVDKENVNHVHRMLSHASRNGLQVILLTHDPDSFTAMGADIKTLPRAV